MTHDQRRMRRSDLAQLFLTGFALFCVATVVVAGQSQEAINATVFERLASIVARLDKIENYLTATIVALISNLVAHIVNIKTQRSSRRG